jgi:hypothetical protein
VLDDQSLMCKWTTTPHSLTHVLRTQTHTCIRGRLEPLDLGGSGGVFSKAAKVIRETEVHITDKKSAKAHKGIGDGIAKYIVELLETGMIVKLEELRAGTA